MEISQLREGESELDTASGRQGDCWQLGSRHTSGVGGCWMDAMGRWETGEVVDEKRARPTCGLHDSNGPKRVLPVVGA